MPINIVLMLMIFGLFFQRKHQFRSVICFASATLLLLTASLAPISDRLMLPIENNYPVFSSENINIDYIIILGCGHENDSDLPATTQLNNCSLQRMTEGLRISQSHPEALIITSGASHGRPRSNATTVKNALVSLGVDEGKIIVEVFPKDTEEEATLIAPRVKGTNVVLVTNADHMPRSVEYFRRQGVEVIPAPTGHWVKGFDGEKNWSYYMPTAKKLQQSSNAWYETLGRAVQWLKDLF